MEKESTTKYIHGLKCRIERILESARKKRKKSGCPLKRMPTPYPMSRVANMPTSSGEKQAGWTDIELTIGWEGVLDLIMRCLVYQKVDRKVLDFVLAMSFSVHIPTSFTSTE